MSRACTRRPTASLSTRASPHPHRAMCVQPIMGDLEMNKFTCEDMPAIDPTGHPEWNCKCVCEKKLEELRSQTCPMACKRLPLDCAHCAPPPPPPPPPPSHLTPDGAKCLPVEKKCCEATLRRLEKYCHAFRPIGEPTFVQDPTHWDGGKWVVSSSFDLLINQYWPEECTKGGPMEVTSVLSHVAAFHHPNLCAAVEAGPCSDLCDRQCEPSRPRNPCTNCTGSGAGSSGSMDIVKQVIKDITSKSAKGLAAEPTQAS